MTRLILLAACLTLLFTPGCSRRNGPEQDSRITDDKAIALAVVGDVDDDVVSRVRQFVSNELGIELTLLPEQAHISGALGEQATALSRLISPDLVCLLALSEADAAVKAHGLLDEAGSTAVINTHALRPGTPRTPAEKEKYFRRVEKEAMRGLGYLLGLKFCPLPMCALSNYKTDEQLDAKGRNFCPPCNRKAHHALVAAGVNWTSEP